MKFRRRVSEPHGIILDGCLPEERQSWVGNCWQSVAKGVSSKSFWNSVLQWMTGSAEPVIQKGADLSGESDLNFV